MSNPILNDKTFGKLATGSGASAEATAGWAAPDPSTRATRIDDQVSPWVGRVMTIGGSLTATGVLLVLLVAAATVGWQAAPVDDGGFPAISLIGVFVGMACVFGLMFKPTLARVLAPIYAIGEGFFVGSLSAYYDARWNGIVIQAVGATLGVALVMLVLYATRTIRVTDRLRSVIISATLGLAVFYLFSWILSLFGTDIGIFNYSSGFGLIVSIFAAGLAAFNLLLDFDFIERGSQHGLPKTMEWVAAFGLLVTLVWLYLEMLRLLARLQQR